MDISRVIAEIAHCFEGAPTALETVSVEAILDLPAVYSPGSPCAIGGGGILFCCLAGIVGLLNAELAIIPS
jgi:hypothetical protein